MMRKPKSRQNKKILHLEILDQTTKLATAGLGLVAALAWNDAIKSVFQYFAPGPGGNVLALFGYAVVITVIVVLITVQLGRLVSTAKGK